MDYSIVMPVFNREDLTHACLATLLPTLEGAGDGEIIVVDNGSRAETAAVLAQFPWVKVIRNETNLGFAAACNQGARASSGRYICHLNNDMIAQPRWLANMIERLGHGVGIVGARLFFPDDTIQHAGVAMYPVRFGPEGIGPHHINSRWPGDTEVSAEPADFSIVTGACLLTPRELFLELNGFDEIFWNGYEDVDYCLRVRERGLRVVYEPSATLYHYESQSGVQRKRRLSHNLKTLGNRWGTRVAPDDNRYWARQGLIRREFFAEGRQNRSGLSLPPATVVVHGEAPADPDAFLRTLRDNRLIPDRILWLAGGSAPPDCDLADPLIPPQTTVGALLEARSDRYFAFVDTRTTLSRGWLDELANAIEYGSELVAATIVPAAPPVALAPCACDARCSILNLRNLPLHIRFGAVDTIDGAIVELTWQAVCSGLGVRSLPMPEVKLPTVGVDLAFRGRYGKDYAQLCGPDTDLFEAACSDPAQAPTMASIVMLSWNAPDYTKLAVESIRAYTRTPYEILIIDNGSGPETLAMLRELHDVRVIYNSSNAGFAHGCNQGIAAASGTHIVLLNNDVIVTEGWLENLLDAHRRDPLVGVSAPRSNRIVGHQQVGTLSYDSIEGMHQYAAGRTRDHAREHYRTNRAIGFCLCISRAVIEEVGGIDTRYGVGNFEDDDFCIRVRAAGYQIVVCEDVFIHHFGSVSFTANNVDYMAQMNHNWKIFAARWNLPAAYPTEGYNATNAIGRGFMRARDYVALPSGAVLEPPAVSERRSYETAFVAVIDSEAAWMRLGPVVTNYIRALSVDDSSLFAIGVTGEADAATIGGRIARSIERLHIDRLRVADIDVADVDVLELDDWVSSIPAASLLRLAKDERLSELRLATDRSPSGLLRTVRGDKR